jgi:hypothetical protein
MTDNDPDTLAAVVASRIKRSGFEPGVQVVREGEHVGLLVTGGGVRAFFACDPRTVPAVFAELVPASSPKDCALCALTPFSVKDTGRVLAAAFAAGQTGRPLCVLHQRELVK